MSNISSPAKGRSRPQSDFSNDSTRPNLTSRTGIATKSIELILVDKVVAGIYPTHFGTEVPDTPGSQIWHPVRWIEDPTLTAIRFNDGTIIQVDIGGDRGVGNMLVEAADKSLQEIMSGMTEHIWVVVHTEHKTYMKYTIPSADDPEKQIPVFTETIDKIKFMTNAEAHAIVNSNPDLPLAVHKGILKN